MQWVTYLEGGPQRVNHAAVPVGHKIYSFGGYNSDEVFEFGLKIDLHVFDTDLLRWRPVHYKNASKAPRKCYGHTVVAYGNKTYLWGGRNNISASNTLYCFDTESLMWDIIPLKGKIPKKVDGHSSCVIGNYMYVFGGFEEETELFANTVYRFNFLSLEWERINARGEPPSSRDFHTASAINEKMYIFGGRSSSDTRMEVYSNVIMYLDTHSMTWVKPPCKGKPPGGRRSHSAVVYHNEIYIIGGFDGETRHHLNDVHKYNPKTSVWVEMHPYGDPPCPRRRHCSCIVGDQLFLFGGSSPLNEEEYAKQYSDIADDQNNFYLQLQDHSDIYILDFFPTLKRLCQLRIMKSYIRIDCLPQCLINEIKMLTTDSRLSKSFCSYPRKDFPGLGISA